MQSPWPMIKIIYWFFIFGLFVVALVTIISSFPLLRGPRVFSVQSGSMAPSILAGSIILVNPSSVYRKGDIISYRREFDKYVKQPVEVITHRIDQVQSENSFITKGDTNTEADFTPIDKDLIIGKVIFTVPFIGFVVSFMKTLPGIIFLVVIPATLIVYSEALNIKNEAVKLWAKRNEKNNS